jgi:hypothetical protein
MGSYKFTDVSTLFTVNDHVEFKSSKMDNRRSKSYARTLRFAFSCDVPEFDGPRPTNVLWPAVKEHLSEALADYDADIGIGRNYVRRSMTYVSVDVTSSASKPSKIPSTDMVLHEMGFASQAHAEDRLMSMFKSAFENALAVYQAAVIMDEKARLTNHLLSSFSSDVLKKSKDVCRYNQRLAALDSELEAEIDAQSETLLKEILKDGVQITGDGDDIMDVPDDVIAMFSRHIASVTKQSRGMFRSTNDAVNSEDFASN